MINLSNYLTENIGRMFAIHEAVNTRDLSKAQLLCSKYLVKKKIYTFPLASSYNAESSNYACVVMFNEEGAGATMAFEINSGSSNVDHMMFFKKLDLGAFMSEESQVADVMAQAKGANILQCIKLIEAVLSGKCPMTVSAVNDFLSEAQLFESLEDFAEMVFEDTVDTLQKQVDSLYRKIRRAKQQNKDYADLQAEYDALKTDLQAAKIAVKGNVTVRGVADGDLMAMEKRFEEEERATPEERFGDMQNYIFNVIKGIRPLALLCGAPGVGKTFRVMNTVKGTKSQITGKPMMMDVDYKLLKGKCTPTALFTAMHDFKEEGQLLIFDDCDSIFKDEDAINLIKAAYDSADERYVTWNTSAAIVMPTELAEQCDDAVYNDAKNRWEYPKSFEYKGSGIIITNFRAGQIDTAIRNRALIADLDFTPTEIIGLIESIAPKIKPTVLSTECKAKAIDYLKEMVEKNMPIELSVRSFTLCAGLFDSNAPEKTIKRQINEQMRLQAARGGRKY